MSKHHRYYRFLIATLLVGGVIFLSTRNDAEGIRVAPSPYGLSINGYGEVQRVFGGDVNGSSRDRGIPEIQALHLNSARAYFWGLSGYHAPDYIPVPKTPWYVGQYGGKAISREESFAQWDEFYKQDFSTLMEAWWQKAYPGTDQVYQAELFRKWDLTSGIILHTELDGSADRNPEGVNHFYKAYLDTVQRHAPWMNIQFVQFQNEPDLSHWSGQFSNTNESVDTFIRSFNRLDAYAQDHFGSTRLLGPCLSSDCFFSLSGWRQWALPVLEKFNQVDYFNYHLYDVASGPHLAWLEMLQATGENLRGVRPRGVITETNFKISDSENKMRFGWEAEQLFMALANPDKLALRTYFLLVYPSASGKDGRNLLRTRDGKLIPSDVYWLYWTLADLRGPMRWIRPETGSELKTCSTSPASDQVVLSLFNDGEQPLSVTAAPGIEKAVPILRASKRQAYYKNGVMQHGETDLQAARSVPLVLAPGEVATVRWDFKEPLPATSRTLKLEQFYCHQTNLPISKGQEVAIHTGRALRPDEVAFMYLGITSDDVLFAKEIVISVNGHPHRVVWSDLHPDVRSGLPNTWHVELLLDPKEVSVDNKIAFGDLDTNYRMLSASVVYRQFPSKVDAGQWIAKATRSSSRAITANMQIPGQWFMGSGMPVTWTLRNSSDQQRTYHIAVELPADAILSKVDLSKPVTLEPGMERKFTGVLEVKETEQIHSATFRLKVSTDDKSTRILTQCAYVYPRLTASLLSVAPVGDGTLSGWESVVPRHFHEGNITAETRLGWDAKNLYMRVDVMTPTSPMKADSLGQFWQRDAIEVFLDLGNQKSLTYDRDDTQLFLIPKSPSNETAAGGIVPRTIRDDSIVTGGPVVQPRFQVKAFNRIKGGYCIEAVIPWDVLQSGFVGRAGRKIGFDLAADHFSPETNTTFSKSIIGADDKPYERPDQWGILTLLGADEK